MNAAHGLFESAGTLGSQVAPDGAEKVVARAPRNAVLDRLRDDLARKFPNAVVPTSSSPQSLHPFRSQSPASNLGARAYPRATSLISHSTPFAWVEVGLGEGGLSWLAAWTLLRLAADPFGPGARPALWIDTHCTLTAGDLLDVSGSTGAHTHASDTGPMRTHREGQGRLVIVRPADPHEAHVAADIALRAGSFSLVALEMHPNLHPTALGRLSRLSRRRQGNARTPLIVWGEPPAFVGPPSGVPRTPFAEALAALFEEVSAEFEEASTGIKGANDDPSRIPQRSSHSTDRMRPLDRAADRRPPPPLPRNPRYDVGDAERPLFARSPTTRGRR